MTRNALTGTKHRDRGQDITRTELANMDRFMDSHPEIANNGK